MGASPERLNVSYIARHNLEPLSGRGGARATPQPQAVYGWRGPLQQRVIRRAMPPSAAPLHLERYDTPLARIGIPESELEKCFIHQNNAYGQKHHISCHHRYISPCCDDSPPTFDAN